jgi:hypothetical protein
MTTRVQLVDFYMQPATMTDPGHFAPTFDALPHELDGLAACVQGLLLHEHWALVYGVALAQERQSEAHIRPVARMLERLLARDGRPLTVARPLDTRLVGVCRHFAVLLVAMLRAQGIPARARCGFGGYFTAGRFEDHWVGEYWHAAEQRWVLVDAQIDALQRKMLRLEFDLFDVPRDRFVVAGDAWAACRAGAADPVRFGLTGIGAAGLWFVAGNVLRDAAALNNMEMLPWDVWGAMPGPEAPLSDEQLAFFDRIAALTREPDVSFEELHGLYKSDDRLRVPATVFNAVLQRAEAV